MQDHSLVVSPALLCILLLSDVWDMGPGGITALGFTGGSKEGSWERWKLPTQEMTPAKASPTAQL